MIAISVVRAPCAELTSDTEGSTNSVDDSLDASSTTATAAPVDAIVAALKRSQDAFYGTTPNLASKAEFYFAGVTGDIAIVKGSGEDAVELLVSGIFEIDRQNFFMGPEGGYLPNSVFNRNFQSTKLSCQLIPVQKDPVYEVSRLDFGAIVANVKGLERLISQKKGLLSLSTVREHGGATSIRLSHTLFSVSFGAR